MVSLHLFTDDEKHKASQRIIGIPEVLSFYFECPRTTDQFQERLALNAPQASNPIFSHPRKTFG